MDLATDNDRWLRKKLKELGAELQATPPGTPEYDRILNEVDALLGVDEEPDQELDDLW